MPEPIDGPEDEPEPLLELSVTSEVVRIPHLHEDHDADDTMTLPLDPSARGRGMSWLRGPVGWALLGALAVGVGLPLAARCGSSHGSAPPASTSRR